MLGGSITELYATHGADLTRFATGLVGPSDAADVVAAVMERMLAVDFTRIDNGRAYLYRSVLNEARAHHRSTLRRRIRETRAAAPSVVVEPAVSLHVLEAVDALSMRQRAVVVLTYWQDLDDDAVARTLGISPGSVRKHLARAHAHLRRTLDAHRT